MLALLLSLLAQAPNTPPRWVHSRTGEDTTVARCADDLAAADVVFLGEEHRNRAGMDQYHALLLALAERRRDVVLSLEMIERDCQGVVNDYLRGRIDEKEFLARSRPWPGYGTDYRPGVELAKTKGWDVIAGNLPRPAAQRVARRRTAEPVQALSPYMPRNVWVDRGERYDELFQEAMKGHPPMGGLTVDRMFEAQCAKDDAMAEAVADYLTLRPHRRPLVVHRCGHFHSDYGLGTAQRLVRRLPLARVVVVSMQSVPVLVPVAELDKLRDRAHYLLLTAAPPAKPAPAKAAPTAPPSSAPAKRPADPPRPLAGRTGASPS